MTGKTIIIVDDHQLVVEGVAQFFVGHPALEVLTTVSNPQNALERIAILKPDIVLTDLDMPGLNGFELIRQIKKLDHQPSIIIVSMHLDKSTVKSALDLDVRGYLPKTAGKEEFVMAVELIAKGQTYYSMEALKALNSTGTELQKGTFSETTALTPREREVLGLIVEGLSTPEISEALCIAPRTVETHRKSIMEKLNVSKVTMLVRKAIRLGLVTP